MPIFYPTLVTLFPEIFPGPLRYSLAGKALGKIWSYQTVNIREFGITKHKKVDDEPYGGGNGLIMRPDVLGPALDYAMDHALDYALANSPGSKIYYPSPRGKIFTQEIAARMANENIIILCGRYEGIDERVIEEYNLHQISIGDYILSGGELAALVILDCIIRLLPGVVANRSTLNEESFQDDHEGNKLLEHPLYTKPFNWRGREVPGVLRSGYQQKITEWKREQSLKITKTLRPDLIK